MPNGSSDGASDDPDGASSEHGPQELARQRALELARVQATDDQIQATLRVEFASTRPQRLSPAKIALGVAQTWTERLCDARVAGQLDITLALYETASDRKASDRTTAAIHLSRRLELLDRLGPDIDKKRKTLLSMSDEDLRGELERVAGRLGLELRPKGTG